MKNSTSEASGNAKVFATGLDFQVRSLQWRYVK